MTLCSDMKEDAPQILLPVLEDLFISVESPRPVRFRLVCPSLRNLEFTKSVDLDGYIDSHTVTSISAGHGMTKVCSFRILVAA